MFEEGETLTGKDINQGKIDALESTIKNIEKQFGRGAIMRLGENSHMNVEVISTGCMSLDLALGVGGLPRGRVVEIFGPESSGKTTVALHVIAQAQGMETVINATGGFKAEIAYATLVGLLFKVSVYYIHEIFQDVITMPVTPIDWDYSLLAEYKEFFNWIQKEFRRTEKVKRRLQGMPQHLALLLEDDPDGYTTLSPAGQVFFSAFEKELIASPPILLSAEAKRFYERLDGTLKNRVDITFDKLRIDCLRTGGSGRVSPADCMVYPRGDCRERLFYYETAEGINVCEIAFHGENYEELMKRGVKKDRYGPFFPVQI
jgi:hypothetical protein